MDLLFSSNRHLASKPFKSVRIDSRNITFERKLRKKFKASTLTLINFRINRNHRNRFELFFYFIVYYIFFTATNLNCIRLNGQNCEEYNRINALTVFIQKPELEQQEISEHIRSKDKLAVSSITK